MTKSEYQKLAIRKSVWNFGMPPIVYYTLGMAGEAVELFEKLQIFHKSRDDKDKDAVVLELGDFLWYFSAILHEMEIDFGKFSYKETSSFWGLSLFLEIGMILDRIKKMFRDNKGKMNLRTRFSIEYHMSKILSLVVELSNDLNVRLETVMRLNIKKLKDRENRGVIHGDGDNR